MLLISGPTRHGLHLYWLDAAGFVKAAFFPADDFPAPMVKVEGDKLRVSAPKRDDLQTVIAFVKGEDFGIPLQFTNYR